MRHVLVVGNGPAAHRLVERLRERGFAGWITVLGAEPRPAYNRALLGSVLDGTVRAAELELPELNADVRLGVEATRIDRRMRRVHTSSGTEFSYDELVLATGARPSTPDVPGLRGRAVTTLRGPLDCARVARLRSHVVVLGGGVLGVETACSLLRRGVRTTLVHARPWLMERHLDAVAGRLLAERLEALGVRTVLGRAAAGFGDGGLVLDDGTHVSTGGVIVCTGIRPNIELAEPGGVAARRGILVDDRMRTSDPHVHAIGDCAEHDGVTAGRLGPAWDQAEALAGQLTGTDARYGGGASIVRLRTRHIDLAALNTAMPSDNTDVITLTDGDGARYARLAVRDDRVVEANIVGLPRAISNLTQLHRRDLPLPRERFHLLLGETPPSGAGPTEVPGNALVCRCNNVTRQTLLQACRRGARDVDSLARMTRVTTGCGACVDDVRRICAQEGVAPT
ncbi:assimilatory nitrate reductase electron transfer subunit [Saccharopolyspora erythraea NRRL 2338]|uniref:Assimilatory nitrite reductase large subunit n=2 Tax=Saccharopolyspora erythraea TaxID=1836 RepID=A4FJF2_SACEN|nr:FAD-dependent oxidoreductase [Saccharopolyspora erythraea]PFG97841.1 assimilatory nitrate reductase electron transfer subunit [Saccharopolyspora erythraea NRRL 2338]QRK87981.1 NAD(P)/FAD-dependent oxidoreductase [Saccharopolyspora erythraea]CAM04177.1 assimilatory nitrite reductase large subunit [Saccharopolyspora erythraea NRRL 2338]